MDDSAQKLLDFVVIGASKAGTTTLFQHLRRHPGLYIPAHKDAPVFTGTPEPVAALQDRVREHFAGAPTDRLWGTVTPSYMEDLRLPARMGAYNPQLRLVAILRDPIDRTYSHYRQQLRLGKAPSDLGQALEPLLETAELERARRPEEFYRIAHYHPVRSEYSRVLGAYLDVFPRSAVHVAFTEDLARDPASVVGGIAGHLGVNAEFKPSSLGKRYHVGGTRQRFPGLVPTMRRVPLVRWAWRSLSLQHRRALWTWFFTRANVVPEATPQLPAEIRSRLSEHFKPENRNLEALLGRKMPWA